MLVQTLKDTTATTYDGVDGSSFIRFLFSPFFFSAKSPSAASFTGLLNRKGQFRSLKSQSWRSGRNQIVCAFASVITFSIKLCYCLTRVSTTKFWFKPFSLFMSKEMFCYCGQNLYEVSFVLVLKRKSNAALLCGSIWSKSRSFHSPQHSAPPSKVHQKLHYEDRISAAIDIYSPLTNRLLFCCKL